MEEGISWVLGNDVHHTRTHKLYPKNYVMNVHIYKLGPVFRFKDNCTTQMCQVILIIGSLAKQECNLQFVHIVNYYLNIT